LANSKKIAWGKNTAESGFDFSWTGKPERYYFVEQSPDLSANSWSLFPYAVKGDGSEAGLFLDPELSIATTAAVLPGADYDGDGQSNLREFLDGTDPIDPFNGEAVSLQIRHGDGQTGASGNFLEQPLVVWVLDAAGRPLQGVPVRFHSTTAHEGVSVFRDASTRTFRSFREETSFGDQRCCSSLACNCPPLLSGSARMIRPVPHRQTRNCRLLSF